MKASHSSGGSTDGLHEKAKVALQAPRRLLAGRCDIVGQFDGLEALPLRRDNARRSQSPLAGESFDPADFRVRLVDFDPSFQDVSVPSQIKIDSRCGLFPRGDGVHNGTRHLRRVASREYARNGRCHAFRVYGYRPAGSFLNLPAVSVQTTKIHGLAYGEYHPVRIESRGLRFVVFRVEPALSVEHGNAPDETDPAGLFTFQPYFLRSPAVVKDDPFGEGVLTFPTREPASPHAVRGRRVPRFRLRAFWRSEPRRWLRSRLR